MMMRMLLALALGAAGCRPAGSGGEVPPNGGPPDATVHEVLTTPSLVGKEVNVMGRCLGYSVPTVAKGPPPVTRSDWQLEDQGEAVWVTGALPPGCSSTEPSEGVVRILATVRQDTLPVIGGQGGGVRQYLVN